MSLWNGEIFNNFITPLSTYLGMGTFLFSTFIFLKLYFGRRWRFEKWRKDVIKNPGNRPAAMVIDLLGIGASVDAQKKLANLGLDLDDRIIIQARQGAIKPDEVPKILEEFREKKKEIANMGADKIYLFISAPTPISAIVGAELANFGGIVLMHWNNQDGIYENWGPLRFVQ